MKEYWDMYWVLTIAGMFAVSGAASVYKLVGGDAIPCTLSFVFLFCFVFFETVFATYICTYVPRKRPG